MRLRSAIAVLTLGASASPLVAQSWAVDEGTFVVLKSGAPGLSESFKIKRSATGLITATGNQTSGTQVTTSSLTTDSLATPVQYELQVKKQGALAMRVVGSAGTRRFTTRSSAGAEESMREYPLVAGHSLILEPGLLHQYYFLPLPGHDVRVHVLQPGASHVADNVVVTSKGLDNITVGRKPVTATRYSVTGLSAAADFWTDSQGRLLRVDIPSQGLSATREELPR